MLIEKKIYEGKVDLDIYGSWDNCDRGLYLDKDLVESIVGEFQGRRVRLTIERLPDPEDE